MQVYTVISLISNGFSEPLCLGTFYTEQQAINFVENLIKDKWSDSYFVHRGDKWVLYNSDFYYKIVVCQLMGLPPN
jgi:hypothetical protein